ncbi:MAG TPA: ATP-binding cassette domain-containing protein, partial [Tissierellaceae bacterium]
TVEDAVKEPLIINKEIDNIDKKVKEYLDKVELDNSCEFLKRRIHTLSGGQRQRIAIARSLIMNPSLLVADEICSMLDKSTEANILRLLKRLQNEEGFAMVYITHNLSVALKLSDRILVMHEGRIVERGNPIKVIKNPQNSYTKELIKFNKENEKVFY